MRISDAAHASGCHQETIRYYERIGLMRPPARRENGYRAYTDAEVERLRFITRGRDLGFSIEEIRSLLRLEEDEQLDCEDVSSLARQHLTNIHSRIRDLKRVAKELERTIEGCQGKDRAQCTILGALRQPAERRH
jgi:MerR family mercuric resistance operon transcriptional regulator